jgi:hypothetical protein
MHLSEGYPTQTKWHWLKVIIDVDQYLIIAQVKARQERLRGQQK